MNVDAIHIYIYLLGRGLNPGSVDLDELPEGLTLVSKPTEDHVAGVFGNLRLQLTTSYFLVAAAGHPTDSDIDRAIGLAATFSDYVGKKQLKQIQIHSHLHMKDDDESGNDLSFEVSAQALRDTVGQIVALGAGEAVSLSATTTAGEEHVEVEISVTAARSTGSHSDMIVMDLKRTLQLGEQLDLSRGLDLVKTDGIEWFQKRALQLMEGAKK